MLYCDNPSLENVWENVIVIVLNLQREAFDSRYPPDCFVLLG